MNKNLILVQNGFPGSNTSGTEIDTLDIKNFFKYEKSVSASKYARKYVYTGSGSPYYISPYSGRVEFNTNNPDELRKAALPSHWYENYTGELGHKDSFKHYSVSFLLFAVRMKKGFLGTNVTITSRIGQDSPVKLKFYNIGDSVSDFSAMKNLDYIRSGSFDYDVYAHRMLSDSIVIPSVNQYNHCFLAALFSDSVYELESGTTLLNNEPLLNISWTETEFTEAQ